LYRGNGYFAIQKRNVLLSCSRDYTANDHVKSIPDGKFYRPYQQEEAEEEIPRYVKSDK
jgi:hypothetical protein